MADDPDDDIDVEAAYAAAVPLERFTELLTREDREGMLGDPDAAMRGKISFDGRSEPPRDELEFFLDGHLRVLGRYRSGRSTGGPALLRTSFVRKALRPHLSPISPRAFLAGVLHGGMIRYPVRWQANRIVLRDVTVEDCRVIRGERLAAFARAAGKAQGGPARAPLENRPPCRPEVLIDVLVGIFRDDPSWTKAPPQDLAPEVYRRDPRFEPWGGPRHPGRWRLRTLEARIRDHKVEARDRAGSPDDENS